MESQHDSRTSPLVGRRGEELQFFELLLCAQNCVTLCVTEVLSLPLRSFLEEDEIQTEKCAKCMNGDEPKALDEERTGKRTSISKGG